MSLVPEDFQLHWRVVQPFFSIRNEDEYDLAIERFERALLTKLALMKGILYMSSLTR